MKFTDNWWKCLNGFNEAATEYIKDIKKYNKRYKNHIVKIKEELSQCRKDMDNTYCPINNSNCSKDCIHRYNGAIIPKWYNNDKTYWKMTWDNKIELHYNEPEINYPTCKLWNVKKKFDY